MSQRFVMRPVSFRIFLLLVCILGYPACRVHAQTEPDAVAPTTGAENELTLRRAVMCEEIQEYQPVNPAVVFSISIGEVYCFTAFSPVPEQTVIDYKWYRRDDLVTTRRVVLYPPKWSTYSSIHLRGADIGPWRVEVIGPEEAVLEVLRFSVTR
ncbi:MAG: DUF2914 domain-containing protein [Thermodesulfobacteriota bacterium]